MSSPQSVQNNVLLGPLTWWKIGGVADHYAQPKSVAEIQEFVRWAGENELPLTILGGGSNILVSDRGIRGLVLSLRNFNRIEDFAIKNDRLEIVTQAGANKAELLKIFMRHKLAPARFLCGLPGEVGGGVVMNAGVGEKITPREFCEIVDWIEVVSLDKKSLGEIKRVQGKDLNWHYRRCDGWQPGLIVRVQVSWKNEETKDILEQVRLATKERTQRQPLDMPSCGSTFRNPEGGKAGALIEGAGLKGFQYGKIQISPKHANFIVNLGGGTAEEVIHVMKLIMAKVQENSGFKLEPEVKLLGEFLPKAPF